MDIYLILAIVLLASIVKGITGFGFALIAMPIIIMWFEPNQLVPILVMCNLIASIIIVLQKKDEQLIDKPYYSLIISGSVFSIVGVLILKAVSGEMLIYFMSAFFIVLSVCMLIGIRWRFKLTPLISSVFGGIIGIIAGSISISGPPLALFLHSAGVSNQKFREIFAWFSICTSIIAVIAYGIVGMINIESIKYVLIFTPCLLIGSAVGKRLNHLLPSAVFKRISLVITIIASVGLLMK